MEQVLDAVRASATQDPRDIPESLWLQDMEQLLTARNVLDATIAARLQVGDSRDVTVIECGRQIKAWLVEDQQMARGEANQRTWVARHLPFYPAVSDAFTAGLISHDHVRIIIGCLQKLPGDWATSCQAELIEFAKHYDPGLLAKLCEELRVRSGADEDAEAAAARKHADRHLSLDETYGGMFSISGVLDPVAGAVIRAALEALMTRNGPDDTRTTDQARADALHELASLGMTLGDLPDAAGDRSTVTITITFDEILNGVAKTHLSSATLNGMPITPNTARMFACDSNILPVVLGGDSEILDFGRTRRQFSRAQRRAMRVRDGETCGWPRGCQTPVWRCHAHHIGEWAAQHGPTDLTNGVHLCRFHHWLIHHSDWTLWRDQTGKLYAARQQEIDDHARRQWLHDTNPWHDPDLPPAPPRI